MDSLFFYTIIESKSYNSPTVTKKIETEIHYFVQLPSTGKDLISVKRDNKALLAALNKPELESYVKTNKLNIKKDEDLLKLLNYYSTL